MSVIELLSGRGRSWRKWEPIGIGSMAGRGSLISWRGWEEDGTNQPALTGTADLESRSSHTTARAHVADTASNSD